MTSAAIVTLCNWRKYKGGLLLGKKTTNDSELLIRIDERTADMYKDICELKKQLFGNGKTGICDRVTKNEDRIEQINWENNKRMDDNDKRMDNIRFYLAFAVSIIIAAVAVINYFKI